MRNGVGLGGGRGVPRLAGTNTKCEVTVKQNIESVQLVSEDKLLLILHLQNGILSAYSYWCVFWNYTGVLHVSLADWLSAADGL